MQWFLKQSGRRSLLIRSALLTGLWLAVTFVFGVEIYLTTRGGPLEIPWKVAAASAFHDWFPWMLLSPVAVVLAARFRFERRTWGRSLAVHLAACLLFAVAYEGVLVLAYPAPFVLTTGGLDGGINLVSSSPAEPSDVPGEGGGVQAFGFTSPLPFPAGSNAVVLRRDRVLQFRAEHWPAATNSGVMTVVRAGTPALDPPKKPVRFLFRSVRGGNKWAQFLRLAMLKTQFTVPIYWCVVCICWVITHFQESGERERRTLELEARLTQANLRTLKMQLQPHFLFNTLNAISSLIHENPKAADDMIGSLSEFLRTTLDVSGMNEVPLRDELEFLERYLEIQQTRFGDRLRVHRELDSAVLDALVPPLILQPLVENAIRHGIERRESGGTVSIRAWRAGDVLHLEVADDGEGFGSGALLGAGNRVGLSNTKARLQALYGDQHQFVLSANPPAGACVRIEIPYHLSPAKAQIKP